MQNGGDRRVYLAVLRRRREARAERIRRRGDVHLPYLVDRHFAELDPRLGRLEPEPRGGATVQLRPVHPAEADGGGIGHGYGRERSWRALASATTLGEELLSLRRDKIAEESDRVASARRARGDLDQLAGDASTPDEAAAPLSLAGSVEGAACRFPAHTTSLSRSYAPR